MSDLDIINQMIEKQRSLDEPTPETKEDN